MEKEGEELKGYHPLDGAVRLSEELGVVLGYSGVETVEEAVSFLCASEIESEGKDEFLAAAREILGEEAYLRYSTPVETPPPGCDAPTHAVKVLNDSTQEPGNEADGE